MIPAKKRSTGNKGSKAKPQLTTTEMVKLRQDSMTMKRLERAIKDVEKRKKKNAAIKKAVIPKLKFG
jgi:hypothetical protein